MILEFLFVAIYIYIYITVLALLWDMFVILSNFSFDKVNINKVILMNFCLRFLMLIFFVSRIFWGSFSWHLEWDKCCNQSFSRTRFNHWKYWRLLQWNIYPNMLSLSIDCLRFSSFFVFILMDFSLLFFFVVQPSTASKW